MEKKIDKLQDEVKSMREEGIKEKGKRKEEQHFDVPPKIRVRLRHVYKFQSTFFKNLNAADNF
jgi:hypothetical protein